MSGEQVEVIVAGSKRKPVKERITPKGHDLCKDRSIKIRSFNINNMDKNEGLSSFIFLEESLTDNLRNDFLNLLVKMKFNGFDYDNEIFVPFREALKKYPDRKRYMLKYDEETFGISSVVGNDFIVCRADDQGNNASNMVKVINASAGMIKTFAFSYIDTEGDPPEKMESIAKAKNIKWLFKYNYFGKGFIEKYGSNFFTNMPCLKSEFVTNEIIKIDLCKNIFESIDDKLKIEIETYLATFSIKARFYDYRQHYIN